MRNVFQTLVMSTVASVMFSCSNGDTNSINLPDEALPKAELHVDVKSTDIEFGTKPNAEASSEATIKNLHLLVFKNKEGIEDNGHKELYEGKDFSIDGTSSVFSHKPTLGHKDLVIVANYDGEKLSATQDLTSFCSTQKALLSTQEEGNFTMVGEQRFEVKGGLNETTVNLSRLVAKVVLKSVAVTNDLEKTIKPKRAFMMNVSNESWLRGAGVSVGAGDPIAHGYKVDKNYLAALTSSYSQDAASTFYVFENQAGIAKTMLVIEADYTKKDQSVVPVYYSIVVKTGNDAKILSNNVYTLSAKIKRPGSLEPEVPSDSGDLEVSIKVDEWIYNPEQGESFE